MISVVLMSRMQGDDNSDSLVTGTVTEALPNTTFMVVLEGGKQVLVYLSGKMRMNHIKVLVGDSVTLKLDSYGERGRIVRRV